MAYCARIFGDNPLHRILNDHWRNFVDAYEERFQHACGVVQGSSVFVRGASTATTGGFGNPLVSTGEFVASIVGTFVSIVLPILAMILVGLMMFLIVRRVFRRRAQSA